MEAAVLATKTVLGKGIVDTKIGGMTGGYVEAYKTASQDLTTNKIIDFHVNIAISLVPMGG